jgi:hypothetical protein
MQTITVRMPWKQFVWQIPFSRRELDNEPTKLG